MFQVSEYRLICGVVDKELIISANPTDVQLALLEDKFLVELHSQKTNSNFTVGDIFIGRVSKLVPGLNAAFVDIGHKKEAFLHYTDLGPKLRSLNKFTNNAISGASTKASLDDFTVEPDIIKTGKINDVITRKQTLLVQILKEPISTKGPRLSCEVTIPGRHLVLTPFNDTIAVSKKIANSEERKRLHRLVESIKPKNFGLIVRTAAEGKKVAELHEELSDLVARWEQMFQQLSKAKPPKKILSELDKTNSILRDLLNDSFSKVVVDDKELYLNVREYLRSIAPEKVDIVKLYNGSRPIFDNFGVTKQIKSAFGKTATLPSGAYIIIEHTEAMHVIDVNSGQKMLSSDQETNALKVNMEAADEIARQLRLRDIGGIIMIDFIDMRNNDNKKLVYNQMKEAMKRDTARHTILPLSKFGLMQITRERVRPEINITTSEACPACSGTGKINASILITDDIQRDLDFVIQAQPKASLSIELHPFLYAYYRQGFPSRRMKWFQQYYKWIKLKPNHDFQLNEYKIFDGNGEEIRLS
jgi:ribonuclease G